MTWASFEPSFKTFCRALSVAGLPECGEPMGHKGAHIFRFVEPDQLFDRCQVMLREYREALDQIAQQTKEPDTLAIATNHYLR